MILLGFRVSNLGTTQTPIPCTLTIVNESDLEMYSLVINIMQVRDILRIFISKYTSPKQVDHAPSRTASASAALYSMRDRPVGTYTGKGDFSAIHTQ